MKLLIFEWNALMQQDLENALLDNNIQFNRFSYSFHDLYYDDFFESRFHNHLSNHCYDAIISFNYFPLVSKVALSHNIRYISWNYDSPVRLSDYSSFDNPNNIIIMFDRSEAESYRKKGYNTVYHCPLAVYTKRLNNIRLSSSHIQAYSSDVSFIGNLHHGNMEQFLAALPEYEWGFLKALMNSQMLLTTVSVTDLISITDLINRWNPYFRKFTNNPQYSISQDDFLYLFGQYVSETERYALLSSFGSRYKMYVYSNDLSSLPTNIVYKGTADYYTEMPFIFKASRINVNPTFRCIKSGIPLRILDILGVGGFLFTNGQPELYDYFVPDKDLIIYDNLDHALDLADYYLSHEDERNMIALSGMTKCHSLFSYDVMLRKIFNLAKLN